MPVAPGQEHCNIIVTSGQWGSGGISRESLHHLVLLPTLDTGESDPHYRQGSQSQDHNTLSHICRLKRNKPHNVSFLNHLPFLKLWLRFSDGEKTLCVL